MRVGVRSCPLEGAFCSVDSVQYIPRNYTLTNTQYSKRSHYSRTSRHTLSPRRSCRGSAARASRDPESVSGARRSVHYARKARCHTECNVYDAAPRTTQKPAAWPAMIAARASPLASPSSLRSSRVLLLGSAKRISSSRSSSNACWPGGGWEDAAGRGGDPSQRPRGSRPSRAWEPSRRALSGLGGAGSSHASRSPEIARDCPRPPPAPHDSHAPLAGRRRQRLEGRQRVDEEQLGHEEREPEQHVGELHEGQPGRVISRHLGRSRVALGTLGRSRLVSGTAVRSPPA